MNRSVTCALPLLLVALIACSPTKLLDGFLAGYEIAEAAYPALEKLAPGTSAGAKFAATRKLLDDLAAEAKTVRATIAAGGQVDSTYVAALVARGTAYVADIMTLYGAFSTVSKSARLSGDSTPALELPWQETVARMDKLHEAAVRKVGAR